MESPIARTASSANIYDVFEPTYIQPALQKPTGRHLGHLIFGTAAWLKMSQEEASTLWLDNPLSQAFVEMGNISTLLYL